MVVLAAVPAVQVADAEEETSALHLARVLLDGADDCSVDALDDAIHAIDREVRQAAWRRGRHLVELVDTLAELHQARVAAREDATRTRRTRFGALTVGLARLRDCGSLGQLLAAAPAELSRCGLDRIVVSRVDPEGWRVIACHADGAPVPVAALTAGEEHLPLVSGGREAEALRRRCAILATAADDAGALMPRFGARSYVVAPVVADGAVIALLHADASGSGRDVDEDDRELVAVFAEALGHAAARAACEQRMAALRGVVRGITDGFQEALDASSCPALDFGGRPGERHVATPAVPATAAAGSRLDALLTRRELEVLRMMADGETNRQIATRLVLSEGTIKSHVKSILRKLHAANRADAVARYVRLEQLPAHG